MDIVGLSAYQSCTFSEKRAVLRTFWSQHEGESDKVVQAAREYGPYALAMVVVINVELVVIFVALLRASSAWAWLGVVAAILVGVSLWWTLVCLRAMRSPSPSPSHLPDETPFPGR